MGHSHEHTRRMFFGAVASMAAALAAKPKTASAFVGVDLATGADRTAYLRAAFMNGAMSYNEVRERLGLPKITAA